MSLVVTVLGCSGTYAGAGGACSGYLAQSATTSIWIDCGSGTLANLQRHVALEDVDAIVCSHHHPDHWLDLPLAMNAFRHGLDLADRQLPVFWTAGTADRFRRVVKDPEPTFAPTIIDETSSLEIGDVALRFSRTDHPVETLAVRCESGGRAFAYTADTGNAWSLSSLGPGLDMAIVEASLNDDHADSTQHLTARQAGEQARRAAVASLVLTHFVPGSNPANRLAEAGAAFDGPIRVASIGDRLTV